MDVKYFYLDNFLLTCTRSSSQLTCHCLISVLCMCEFQHIASSLILYLIDFNFLQSIHDQEDEVELLKSKCEKAREDFANAKLELREQLNEGLGKCSCQSLTADMQEIFTKKLYRFQCCLHLPNRGCWGSPRNPNYDERTWRCTSARCGQ